MENKKQFLDLAGLQKYDELIKDHITSSSVDGDYVSVTVSTNGDHAVNAEFVNVTVDETKLASELTKYTTLAFSKIATQGGTVIADQKEDTLTIKNGSNITVTGSDIDDSITISASMDFTGLNSEKTGTSTYVGVTVKEVDGLISSVTVDDNVLKNNIQGITDALQNINDTLVGGVNFIGVTTTNIDANPKVKTVKIGNVDVTAKLGDIVLYKYESDTYSNTDTAKEYIYTGETTGWEELGSPDKCTKLINDLDSRVSVVETDLVTSIYDATAANTCSPDLVNGKLSTTIDTSIVNSDEDPGYILPVFRDLDKNGFVHIKAIPASEITALFA